MTREIPLSLSFLVNSDGGIIGDCIYTDDDNLEDRIHIEIQKRRGRPYHMSAGITISKKLATDVSFGILTIGNYHKKISPRGHSQYFPRRYYSSNCYSARDRKKSHAYKRMLRLLTIVEKEYDVKFI